jgi:hypothetical protein
LEAAYHVVPETCDGFSSKKVFPRGRGMRKSKCAVCDHVGNEDIALDDGKRLFVPLQVPVGIVLKTRCDLLSMKN